MKYLQFNRETEQTSPRVVRLAFTSRLAHQKPPRRRPQSSRRPETDDEARHSGRPGNAEELLVRSYYQFNTASYSKLRSEVWSGNLKYRAGRLRGNRLCRTFSFSRCQSSSCFVSLHIRFLLELNSFAVSGLYTDKSFVELPLDTGRVCSIALVQNINIG
ncbi:Hypothetical_protein [Hexamita inflata]|uniref:Hypothetical_protein n=1 Tax=Hexamita inflata TaxID=28002 RepID=A0AA86RI42_9EUKA|nr:Hypothetical protein HINF_LOCUS65945 [Hexamita inflata]